MSSQTLERSPIAVSPRQLETLLGFAIPNRQPILITGSPGGGKTSVVMQAAERLGVAKVLVNYCVTDESITPRGFPVPNADRTEVRMIPYGNLASAFEGFDVDGMILWFLDDFGQADQGVQAAYMNLLQSRRDGSGRLLPDNVTFVLASNRRSDKCGVSGILECVKGRCETIVELVPELESSCLYALDNDWPIMIPAFWRWSPSDFNNFEASNDMANSPTPRTWEAVGRWLSYDLPGDVLRPTVAGAIGATVAARFLAFVDMFKLLPNIDGILIDGANASIPIGLDAIYATCTAVGARATVENFDQIAVYAERLAKAERGDQAALILSDAVRRVPAIAESVAYVSVQTSTWGQELLSA